MISPKDAEPVCAVWIEQLDRFKISPNLYEMLLNNSVDTLTKALKNGDNPPNLTVELFLAEFAKYRESVIVRTAKFANNVMIENDINLLKRSIAGNTSTGWERSMMYETNTNSPQEALTVLEAKLNYNKSMIAKILAEAHLEVN